MHSRSFRRVSCSVVCSPLLALSFFCIQSHAKPIKLRNELIEPASATNLAVMAANSKASGRVSDVFLVQFNGPLDPGRRAELKAAGVELLKYVPEDAFIA